MQFYEMASCINVPILVNPNTLWSQFLANISRMVGRINTGTSALSLYKVFNGHMTSSYRDICMKVTPQSTSIWIHCSTHVFASIN